MAREDLHFRLRIPERLKKQIEEYAEANHRSMTAEIIARLEMSFEPILSPSRDPNGMTQSWADKIESLRTELRRVAAMIEAEGLPKPKKKA